MYFDISDSIFFFIFSTTSLFTSNFVTVSKLFDFINSLDNNILVIKFDLVTKFDGIYFQLPYNLTTISLVCTKLNIPLENMASEYKIELLRRLKNANDDYFIKKYEGIRPFKVKFINTTREKWIDKNLSRSPYSLANIASLDPNITIFTGSFFFTTM